MNLLYFLNYLSENRQNIMDIATVGGFVVAILGIYFIWKELDFIKRTQYLEAWRHLDKDLSSEDNREARKYCYHKLPSDPKKATDEDWRRVEFVANSFERVGFYVDSKFLPKSKVLDLYASVVIRSWKVLEPYVKYDRCRRMSLRRWRHFEMLHDQAECYRRDYFPEHQVHIYREDITAENSVPSEESEFEDNKV